MRKLFLLLILLSSLPLFAQKVKTVEGEYVYYAPENVTPEEAKRTALDRAKIQAIANEFNTLVTQDNETRVRNRNGQSDIDFLSVGGSEVKGEWIETIGEPVYTYSFEGGQFIVTCKVKGKARELVAAAVDFKAHILRNGIADKFESKQFKEGDYLYLSFQSPVKGHLAVYLDRYSACYLIATSKKAYTPLRRIEDTSSSTPSLPQRWKSLWLMSIT